MTLPLVGVRRPSSRGERVRMSSYANRLAQPLDGPALRGILRTSSPTHDDTVQVSGTPIRESAMAKKIALHKLQATSSNIASHRSVSRYASTSPRPRHVITTGNATSARRHLSVGPPIKTESRVYSHTHSTVIRPAEKVQMYHTPKHRSTQILHPEGLPESMMDADQQKKSQEEKSKEEGEIVEVCKTERKTDRKRKSSKKNERIEKLGEEIATVIPKETPTFRQKESRSSSKIVAPPPLQNVHPAYLAMGNRSATATPSETASSLPTPSLPTPSPPSPRPIDYQNYGYPIYHSPLPHPFNRYIPPMPWPQGRGVSGPVMTPQYRVATPQPQSRMTSAAAKQCDDCFELKRKITELERQAEATRLQLEKQKDQVRLQQEYYRSGQADKARLPESSAVTVKTASATVTPQPMQPVAPTSVNPVWPPAYGGQVRISRPQYLESSSYTSTTSTSMMHPRQPPRRRRRSYKYHSHKRRHRSLSLSSASSSSSSSSVSSRGHHRHRRSPHHRRKSSMPEVCKCKHHRRNSAKHHSRKPSLVRHVSVAPVRTWRMPSLDQVSVPMTPIAPPQPQTITGETPEEIEKRLETMNYVNERGSPARPEDSAPLQSVRVSDASYTTISNLRPVGSKPRRAVCCA